MAASFKRGKSGDIVVWREGTSRGGYTYGLGVVATVDPKGKATHARVWCTGIGPGGFKSFKIPQASLRWIASATMLTKPAEYIACHFGHAITKAQVSEFMAQFKKS